MDIIKEVLKQIDEKERHDIWLREIALLMEENEMLKGELRKKDKLIKKLKKSQRRDDG